VTAAKELEQHRAELLQRAEEANRAKDEFLATFSHELRQPLNALVGWAEMMDRVPAERAIPSIRRNAAALSQLVHDLLDTSRIMAGKLHMKVAATDLAAVVRDVADTLRPSAERKGIAVSIGGADLPVWVMGDGGRLRQAVLNLLSNAVKFTPENGRIDVTLAETETATVMLTVRDTGVGIPPDILPHVFDRFVQAETSARVGLGLGLAITKHIAEAHGGSVHAQSGGPMQGATFTLTLPLAPRSTASTAHPRQSRENVHS
jgi:signal transduction histidine kinase